ncbi:MAG: cytochrome c maturation protein CcmE [bacterium]|nr:cytochrome c maturation protein CcmE [bacterium]
MAQVSTAHTSWEQPQSWEKSPHAKPPVKNNRVKFFAGGVLIIAAVAYLLVSGTASSARRSMTIDELLANPDLVGQTIRLTGAVVGSTIREEGEVLTFTIAHIPRDTDDLAQTLHLASNDPTLQRVTVRYEGPRPDLLQHEAQALLSGSLDENGVFHANELLLKCPSRFEEGAPALEGLPSASESGSAGS